MGYAIRFPNGEIDQYYVGVTKRDVWFERGWYLMCDRYKKEEWENRFWKRERASRKDFEQKGYSIVKVRVVTV